MSLMFHTEGDSVSKYLVLALKSCEKIYQYQVEMMENNVIPGILTFDIRHTNTENYLYYLVTSRVPLQYFLKERKIKKHEFIMLLQKITEVIIQCKKYYLWDSSLILTSDRIFIHPVTLDVAMVYVPTIITQDPCTALKELVMDMIINLVQIDEEGGDAVILPMLNYLKSPFVNVVEFESILSGLVLPQDNNIDTIEEYERPSYKGFEKEEKEKAPINIRSQKIFQNVIQVDRYIMAIVLLQALMIILILTVISITEIKELEILIGLLVIIAGIDIWMVYKIFHMRGKKMPNQSASDEKKEVACNLNKMSLYPHPDSQSEHTVLLSMYPETMSYLVMCGDQEDKKICISKDRFVIGRMKEEVDCVSYNRAVGKKHAEIIFKDGKYYLVDLNSKNGTYINKARIHSNQECLLKHQDHINFANSEYVFTTEEQ